MPFDNFSFGHVDADTRTLRAAMTVPPPAGRLWQIDQTIRQLKQHGIWQKLDVLWMLAAHDAQTARLNWKNPSQFALTAVNSPTFTANRGYTGDGDSAGVGTKYLTTGWTPSTNAIQFTQDSGTVGVYLVSGVGTNTANNNVIPFGSIGTHGSFINVWGATSNALRGRINQGSTAETSSTVSTRFGLSVLDRSAASLVTGYRNGAANGTFTTASAGLPTQPFSILALNNGGTLQSYVDNQIGLAFAGASLTAAQHAALNSMVRSYLLTVGTA